jgi:hypothetical protein
LQKVQKRKIRKSLAIGGTAESQADKGGHLKRLPGAVVILLTRARIRIVKRRVERRPPSSIPAVLCGLRCPGDEELAAYIDGRLATGPRERVREHLSYCPKCYAVYFETVWHLKHGLQVE